MQVILSLALFFSVVGCAATSEFLELPVAEINKDTTGQFDGTWSASYETKHKNQRVVVNGKFEDFPCKIPARTLTLTILDGKVSGKIAVYTFTTFVNDNGRITARPVYSARDKQLRKAYGVQTIGRDWIFNLKAQLDSQASKGEGTETLTTPKTGLSGCNTDFQLKRS